MKRIALVLPWVGKRPKYWTPWLRSAEGRCFDVIAVEKTLDEFSRLVQERLADPSDPNAAPLRLRSGYKLCDLKPMYGILFAEALERYDYWAFGDCDVLYGRGLDAWIERAIAADCDVASVQGEYCAGPFTLVRNCERCNHLFEKAAGWREMLLRPQMMTFDELGPNWFRRQAYGGADFGDLRAAADSFSAVCWREAAAGRLRLVHETVICETALGSAASGGGRVSLEPDGRLLADGREVALYHFIDGKNRPGFSCDETGVWIAGGWPFVRDLLAFAGRLLRGRRRDWCRVSECVQRKLGLKGWQREFPWNNR